MTVELRDRLRAGHGGRTLADVDPRELVGLPAGADKTWAREQLATLLGPRLATEQEKLFATVKSAAPDTPAGRRRLLLVLQGMDCSGKGGTVRRVVGGMNPQGVRVVAFGPPTEEELARHFLWRVERQLPPPGYVGAFDRSHYEDVLIARVNELVSPQVWQARYDEINDFEAGLVADGVTVVKVLLHLSYQEQTRRLTARLDNPEKHWKFHPADIDDRRRWDDYQHAYQDVLSRCDSDSAPWYVVPADRKWYRDWAVAQLLLATFGDLGLSYPPAAFDVAAERERLTATA